MASYAGIDVRNHVAATAGPTTERLFGDEVKSCAKCHHVDAGNKTVPLAVPARRGSEAAKADWRYGVARTQFAGFVDAQFHPLGGECRACHRQVENPNADNMAGANRPRANQLLGCQALAGRAPGDCAAHRPDHALVESQASDLQGRQQPHRSSGKHDQDPQPPWQRIAQNKGRQYAYYQASRVFKGQKQGNLFASAALDLVNHFV